jgi:hypothetical protein
METAGFEDELVSSEERIGGSDRKRAAQAEFVIDL